MRSSAFERRRARSSANPPRRADRNVRNVVPLRIDCLWRLAWERKALAPVGRTGLCCGVGRPRSGHAGFTGRDPGQRQPPRLYSCRDSRLASRNVRLPIGSASASARESAGACRRELAIRPDPAASVTEPADTRVRCGGRATALTPASLRVTSQTDAKLPTIRESTLSACRQRPRPRFRRPSVGVPPPRWLDFPSYFGEHMALALPCLPVIRVARNCGAWRRRTIVPVAAAQVPGVPGARHIVRGLTRRVVSRGRLIGVLGFGRGPLHRYCEHLPCSTPWSIWVGPCVR